MRNVILQSSWPFQTRTTSQRGKQGWTGQSSLTGDQGLSGQHGLLCLTWISAKPKCMSLTL